MTTVTEYEQLQEAHRRLLTEIDLLEISVAAVPVHQSTRTLSWKRPAPDVADREHEVIADAFAKESPVSSKPDQPASHGKPLADLSFADLTAYGDELTKDIETRPIRIVSFEC